MKIILASKSGVRKEILDKYKIANEVIASNVDEDEIKDSLKKDYDKELEKVISSKDLEHKLEIEKITLENSHAASLRETIQDLKAKLNSNEKDLVIAKQRVFEAIRSIPQSITIVDETRKKG